MFREISDERVMEQAVTHAHYKVLEIPDQFWTEGDGELDLDLEELKLAIAHTPVPAEQGVASDEGLSTLLSNLFVIGFCIFVWAVWIVALLSIG